ncbi:hypothetical protein ACA910_018982 [Epithemia clementina (nom. ined.)]
MTYLFPLLFIFTVVAAAPYHTLTAGNLPPENLTAARPKPLTGFLTSPTWHGGVNGYLNPQILDASLRPPTTLEFYYVGLIEVMDGMNSFPGFDTFIEPKLAASASRGKHVILRFFLDYPQTADKYVSHTPEFLVRDFGVVMTKWWYDDLQTRGGLSPDYSDPNLILALQNFIAALGQRYDGDTRLGFIQLGLLGFWGEWHTYTGNSTTNNWIPDSTKVAVIDAFDSAFQTTMLQVRYIHSHAVGRPNFGLHDDSFAYSTVDSTVSWFFWSQVTAAGATDFWKLGPICYRCGGSKQLCFKSVDFGLHDDSFAYSTVDSTVSWFFWSQVTAAGATDFWKLGPMGGEVRPELQSTIFDPDYPAGTPYHQDINMCIDTTHTTYMINYHAFALGNGYTGQALTNAIAASDRMGYAFRVSQVAASVGSSAGTVDVAVTVTQDGVAPFYFSLDLKLVCNNGSFRATRQGVNAIKTKGSSSTFTFVAVPGTSSCLSSIKLMLDSPYAFPGVPVKFAQGTLDGTTVGISLPVPGPTCLQANQGVCNASNLCCAGLSCQADGKCYASPSCSSLSRQTCKSTPGCVWSGKGPCAKA